MDDDKADCPAAAFTRCRPRSTRPHLATRSSSARATTSRAPARRAPTRSRSPRASRSRARARTSSRSRPKATRWSTAAASWRPTPDLRNGLGDIVAIVGTPTQPLTVNISGVTVDGYDPARPRGRGRGRHRLPRRQGLGHPQPRHEHRHLRGRQRLHRTRAAGAARSRASASSRPRDALLAPVDGARQPGRSTAPASTSTTSIGVLIDGAQNDCAPVRRLRRRQLGRHHREPDHRPHRVRQLRRHRQLPRHVGLLTTGPLFGQDGLRVTSGSYATVDSSLISQNLVNGTGAPARNSDDQQRQPHAGRGRPLRRRQRSTQLHRRATGQVVYSRIERSNIVDNAYGVLNVAADGTTAVTGNPNADRAAVARATCSRPRTTGGACELRLADHTPARRSRRPTNPPVPENPVNGAATAETGQRARRRPTPSTSTRTAAARSRIPTNGAVPDPDARRSRSTTPRRPSRLTRPGERATAAPRSRSTADAERRLRHQARALRRRRHDARNRHAAALHARRSRSRPTPPATARRTLQRGRDGLARPDDSRPPTHGHRHLPPAAHADATRRPPRPRPRRRPPVLAAAEAPGRRRLLARRSVARQVPRRVRRPAPAGLKSAAVVLGTACCARHGGAVHAATFSPTGADVGAQALRVVVTDALGATAEARAQRRRREVRRQARRSRSRRRREAQGRAGRSPARSRPRPPSRPPRPARARSRSRSSAPAARSSTSRFSCRSAARSRARSPPSARNQSFSANAKFGGNTVLSTDQPDPEVLLMSFRRNARRAALARRRRGARRCRRSRGLAGATSTRSAARRRSATTTAIPTWDQFLAGNPDPDAVIPLGWGTTGAGGGAPFNGSGAPNAVGPQPDRGHLRVLGRHGRGDREQPARRADQEVPGQVGLGPARHPVLRRRHDGEHRQARRPRTATPPSGAACARARSPTEAASRPPAPGPRSPGSRPPRTAASPRRRESITRNMYELLARTDCENARRLQNLDFFLQPVRNPDGRDAMTRTTAFGLRPEPRLRHAEPAGEQGLRPGDEPVPGRLLHRRPPAVERVLLPAQRGPGPPRDLALLAGLHPERDRPGAAAGVQRPVRSQYQQLQPYDLFTPEYGDTVPVADHGRGRHDVREGQQRGLRQAGLRPLPGDRHDDEPDVQGQGQHHVSAGSGSGPRPSSRARTASCRRTSSSARCTTRSSSSPRATTSAATSSSPTSTPATSRR